MRTVGQRDRRISAGLIVGYVLLVVAAELGRLWWPSGAWLIVVGLATAAAATAAPVRFPTRDPPAWLSLAVAALLFSLADTVFGARPTPPVRPADVIYLPAYALVVVTLYRLNRQVGRSAGFLDAAVLATGLVLVLVAVLARHASRADAGTLTLLYPLAGLVIVTMSVRLMRSLSTPTSWLMLAAAVFLLVSGLLPIWLSYQAVAAPVQALLMGTLACWGLTALSPPPANLWAVDAVDDRRPPVWLFVAIVLLVPVALLIRVQVDSDTREMVLAAACAAAGLFAVTRLGALARASTTDAVTGLMVIPVLLIDARTRLAAGKTPTLFLVDLDQFHVVNEWVGRQGADRVQRQLARELCKAAGDAQVARGSLGRFAVLAELPATAGAAGRLADGLTAAVAGPVTVDGTRLDLTCSVGYATAASADVDDLLVNAEVALHAAKSARPGARIGYDPRLREADLERAALIADLRTAMGAGQLVLEYQPIVALDGGRVEGFEALVRWQHPRLGRLGPDRFVHLAESAGLIGDLGAWVLAEGVAGAAALNVAAGRPVFVDINVSAGQLGPELAGDLRQALASHGVDPSLIVLELTETMLVPNRNWLADELAALKSTGVRVAIDDFGTGHSSLARLRDLPIDVIKIDRMFVDGLTPGAPAQLIAGILQIATALNVEVVAEGIEQASERDLLDKLGCHLGQGFLYSRPVGLAEAQAMVRAGPVSS